MEKIYEKERENNFEKRQKVNGIYNFSVSCLYTLDYIIILLHGIYVNQQHKYTYYYIYD